MEDNQSSSSQSAASSASLPSQRLDSKTIAVILLLVFSYPLGVVFMWFWMKTWPGWMKLLLSLALVLGIVLIVLSVSMIFIPFSKQASTKYVPSQSAQPTMTKQQENKNKSTGNSMFDQADDVARKSNINAIESALKLYYAENQKPPETLSLLVPKYIASETVFLDFRTKEPLPYNASDQLHGCVASTTLTTGEVLYAYCK